MIDRVEEVRSAVCDCCGISLIEEEFGNVNYARLEPYFGYGSPMDYMVHKTPAYDLCEKCYQYVRESIDAIRIKRSDYD